MLRQIFEPDGKRLKRYILPIALLAAGSLQAQQIKSALDSLWNRHFVRQSLRTDSGAHSRIIPAYPDSMIRIRFNSMNSPFRCGYDNAIKPYILLLTQERRKAFEVVCGMAEQYFPFIEKALSDAGLPDVFKYIPVAGSALDPLYTGADGGAGIWHMHYAAASRFALHMTEYVDERHLPERSTQAAVQYLSLLQREFSLPDLVLAAWFCGPGGVHKAIIRSKGSKDLWRIYPQLPEENREFIPAFFAAYYCMTYREDYRLTPFRILLPRAEDTVEIRKKLSLKAMAVVAGIDPTDIREANFFLRKNILPAASPDPIRMRPEDAVRFRKLRDSVYVYQDSVLLRKSIRSPQPSATGMPEGGKAVFYTVKPGDNLGFIAENYHVGITALKKWNDLDDDMIYAGQILRILIPGSKQHQHQKKDSSESRLKETGEEDDYIYYTVQQGESLWFIARKFPGVSAANIMELNHIDKDIKPGQRLKIKRKNERQAIH